MKEILKTMVSTIKKIIIGSFKEMFGFFHER